ncbi:DUF5681 domain-containing protein [Methylobacterium sp. A54F]
MTTRGRAFEKGRSGNPAGRPRGSRNRSALALEELLDGEAKAITRKAIEMAKAGDTVAMRLCLERLIPARKDRIIRFGLPPIEGPQDLPKATTALLQAVADGDLTAAEAAELSKLVEAHVRAVETKDFAERLAALEANAGAKR